MTSHIATPEELEAAPEPPPQGVQVWLRENLFSSLASSILTVIALVIAVFGIRALMGFLFGAERRWDAVTANMRLLMIQAYPAGDNPSLADEAGNAISQVHRVWLSVALVFVLLALSLAVFRVLGRISPRKLGGVLLAIGGGLGLAIPGSVFLSEIITTVVSALTGGGFSFSVPVFAGVTWLYWIIGGGVFLAAGLWFRNRPNAKEATIPLAAVVAAAILALVVAIWVVPVPVPEFVETADGFDQVIDHKRAATTTTMPWTVIAGLTLLAYGAGLALIGRADADREHLLRRVLVGLWVISFPVIVLVILRDPEFDYGRIFSWYIPVAVAFIVVGAAILRYAVGPTSGEAGRVIAAVLVVVALVSFFVSMGFIIRFGLLSLALFALASPTFAGEGEKETRYIAVYAGWIAIMTYLVILISAPSTVEVRGDFFLGGLALTFLIAISGIAASFPIGVVLALGRTSTLPLFRLMSTVYIEVIRGVPLITWLLVGALMLPVALPPGISIAGVMRAIGAVTFFSAAYLAENVRGGLQSIPRGQYEAARALGMSTVQMTVFITLPQALRAVIPALVGQVIALFKDTSLVTIIGLFDFLHIARAVIPVQTQPFNFLGSIKETLVFAAIIYWIFTFTFSRVSLRLERKLGVGVR